jgi:processive 1,2-diacylglycerol beta-glucosyltransferase
MLLLRKSKKMKKDFDMKYSPKILIFYASYGDGHIQVSRALLANFQERGIFNVQMIDLFAKAHPILDAMSRFIYLKSTAYCPTLYGWSYYLTLNMQHDQKAMKWLNSFCIQKFTEIIELEKPDAIVHTFPMMSVPESRKPIRVHIPTFTILTDYALHSRWLQSGIDKYFVATEDLGNKMITKGIRKEQITVSGIPIRKIFHEVFNIDSIFQHYGLEHGKKHILIMAGAYGVFSILKKMILLLLSLEGVQIIIVCGRNMGLQANLEAFFKEELKVTILGFIEQIQELMAISSCIITKAGGITLSEAIALQLPIIVFRPVPGQEKENASYLAEKKQIFLEYDLAELKKVVQQIITLNMGMHKLKQQSMSSRKKTVAAEIVVSNILQEINYLDEGRKSNEIQ